MNQYFILMSKCFIVYFVIIFALRVMGKREVGELSVFDIVIYLVMSELLALSITETHESILKSLVPIFTLAGLQIILSWIILKCKTLRNIFDGRPIILIHNGHIHQKRMKRERYNIDDLMSQIRSKSICTPDAIAFAVLETNGQLSILEKKCCHVLYPDPLINDGIVNKCALKELHVDEAWLLRSLKVEGVTCLRDVFLCMYQKDGFFVIMKEVKTHGKGF